MTKQRSKPPEATTAGTVTPKTAEPKLSLFDAEWLMTRLEDALAQASDGEPTNEALETLADQFLEASNGALDAIERYCYLIHHRGKRAKQREATAKAWREDVTALFDLAKQDTNLVKRLKQRLLDFMDRRAVTRLETTHFKLSAKGNGGLKPLILDETYSAVTAAAFYPNLVRLEFDQDAVRAFLEAGGELPFAQLVERGRSLVIKP
ncbi:MAG: siphovirus Gp157 family protein [Stenomitos frigidus ULC029]